MSCRFVFVVPFYNAQKTIKRMLESVFLQTYEHWLILLRDDMSTDHTPQIVRDVCERHGVPWEIQGDRFFGRSEGLQDYFEEIKREPKVKLIINNNKFWEVRNVLEMINDSLIKEDDIICRLDGDDFLCDLCILQDLDKVYSNNPKAGCVWTAHRWSDSMMNISQALPERADPYKYPWVSSHFKTFRKHLITSVPDENFRGLDGEYIKRAGDQAIYLPVLWQAREYEFESLFFPRIAYYYTIDIKPKTFQTDDAKFQLSESEFLRKRGYISIGKTYAEIISNEV